MLKKFFFFIFLQKEVRQKPSEGLKHSDNSILELLFNRYLASKQTAKGLIKISQFVCVSKHQFPTFNIAKATINF